MVKARFTATHVHALSSPHGPMAPWPHDPLAPSSPSPPTPLPRLRTEMSVAVSRAEAEVQTEPLNWRDEADDVPVGRPRLRGRHNLGLLASKPARALRDCQSPVSLCLSRGGSTIGRPCQTLEPLCVSGRSLAEVPRVYHGLQGMDCGTSFLIMVAAATSLPAG